MGFGIAVGGIEAVMLAVAGLAELAHAEDLVVASVLTGPMERASALLVHVVSCVLLLSPTFRARPMRFFAISFLYKSIVDAVAAVAVLQLGVTRSTPKLLAFEAVIAILAIGPALLFGRRSTSPIGTLASAGG